MLVATKYPGFTSSISMAPALSHKHALVCDMRGFLTLLILWLLSKKPASGAELAREIEKRKGCRPNPGTIYPALKELQMKKAIAISARQGRQKVYHLTPLGEHHLEVSVNSFCKTFYDVFTR